ncbi:MAG: HAD-IA family hydrolase [Bacillota bacterium]|nr:HAD-IA family hydrolase [Bacillota bacterium]
MPLRYEAVLFDLDGTLIDTRDLILASFHHALRRVLGRDLPDEVLLAGQGTTLIDQMRCFDGDRAEELTRVYTEFNLREHDALAREFPGVQELLRDLYAIGVHLGVVTSKRREGALLGLRRFGIAPYLTAAVFMEDTREHKPSPAPVREALRRLGCAPARAVMAGDSPYDVQSARSAGVEAVGVAWGSHPPASLREAGATVVVHDLGELRNYLWKNVTGQGRRASEYGWLTASPCRPATRRRC